MAVTVLEGNKLKIDDIRTILEKKDSSVFFAGDDKDNSPLKMIAAQGGLWNILQAAGRIDPYRETRYKEYDQMEDDGIIASALEMSVDDATQYSREANATVWPMDDSEFKDDISELLYSIDFENRVWGWTYNIAKYGDYFLRVYKEEGKGIVGVDQHIHPGQVYRLDIKGMLAGFIMKSEGASVKDSVYSPSDFVHFINNFKPNFEKTTILTTEGDKEVKKVITSAYGSSILQNSRRVYKILNLLEVSMALARLARAPMVRVYYVNTTGMDPDTRKKLIQSIEEEFKKKKSVDVTKDWYEQKYSPLNNTSDLFLPIAGEVGDMRLEQIGGDVNVRSIVDIDYMKDKLFASLRTPKSFLGFTEAVPASIGAGSSLGRLDIRYARMTKKIQRALLEGLYRLVQIHISYKYKKEQSIRKTHLAAVPISSSDEDSKMEYMERKMGLAQSMLDMIQGSGKTFDPEYLIRYVLTRILDLPALDLDKLLSGKVPKAPVPIEIDNFLFQLKAMKDSDCTSIDIFKLVESFLKTYAKKVRYMPKSKDLNSPTLSEVKLEKNTRLYKRNNSTR